MALVVEVVESGTNNENYVWTFSLAADVSSLQMTQSLYERPGEILFEKYQSILYSNFSTADE